MQIQNPIATLERKKVDEIKKWGFDENGKDEIFEEGDPKSSRNVEKVEIGI